MVQQRATSSDDHVSRPPPTVKLANLSKPTPTVLAPSRILIVEDDQVTADLWWQLLTREGFLVDLAPDAEAGWEAMQLEPPALVILDLILPGGASGVDFLQWVRSSPRFQNLPVFVFSTSEEWGRAAATGGANRVFNKNTSTFQDVLQTVHAQLKV